MDSDLHLYFKPNTNKYLPFEDQLVLDENLSEKPRRIAAFIRLVSTLAKLVLSWWVRHEITFEMPSGSAVTAGNCTGARLLNRHRCTYIRIFVIFDFRR